MIWIVMIVVMILSMVVQRMLSSRFDKYSFVPVSLTGAEVAQRMLQAHGINDVKIVSIEGTLTDHYNPADNTLNLSPEVYEGRSLSSLGVACHEAGHALQKARGYLPMQVRTSLVPVVNLTSQTWMLVFLAGAMLGSVGLTRVAIYLFAFSVVCAFIIWLTEPAVENFGDAIWYCYAVVTTIGFGDLTPTTGTGRFLSVILGI